MDKQASNLHTRRFGCLNAKNGINKKVLMLTRHRMKKKKKNK